jgi:hypothetical protein
MIYIAEQWKMKNDEPMATGTVEGYMAESIEEATEHCLYSHKLSNGKARIITLPSNAKSHAVMDGDSMWYIRPDTTSKITVTMEGGIIQDITGIPEGVCVEVIDFDVEGIEESRIEKVNGHDATVVDWTREEINTYDVRKALACKV